MKSTEQKQLLHARLQTVMMAMILLLLVLAAVVFVREFAALRQCMDTIQESVQDIDVDAINGAVNALTDAANNLEAVDTTSLNSVLSSLQSVAAQLQRSISNLTGIFGH